MTTPARTSTGLSRRALFGIGGSTLLLATAAAALRRRLSRAEASGPARADAPIAYADHEGWMVTVAEKQALQAQPRQVEPPPGGAR